MRHAIAIGIFLGILVACQTPEILEPHVPPGHFNPNTDTMCVGGGWCTKPDYCGGRQIADQVVNCPADFCCADNDITDHGMGARRRMTRQRHP